MNPETIKEYYEAYWQLDEERAAPDLHALVRLRLLARLVGDASLSGTALDVGCGRGHVVAALGAAGFDASGFDVSQTAVDQAREAHGPHFAQHAIEERPWPVEPASVDLVVAFEVLEHLLRPRVLFEAAHDALRPGGRLALTTPYHGRLKNLALSVHGFDRHFAVEGDHLRFFSDRALRDIATASGFAGVQLHHFGRVPGLWAGVFLWAVRR